MASTYLPELTDLPEDFRHISVMAYHSLIVLHTQHYNEIEDQWHQRSDVWTVLSQVQGANNINGTEDEGEASKDYLLVTLMVETDNHAAWIKELGIACGASCLTGFLKARL